MDIVTPSQEVFDPQADEIQQGSIENALSALDQVGDGTWLKGGYALRDLQTASRLVQRFILFRQLIRTQPDEVEHSRFVLSLGKHQYGVTDLVDFVTGSERELFERLDNPEQVAGEAGVWYQALAQDKAALNNVKNMIKDAKNIRHPGEALNLATLLFKDLSPDLASFATGLVIVGISPPLIAKAAVDYMKAWNEQQQLLREVGIQLSAFKDLSPHAIQQMYQWIGLDLFEMVAAVVRDVLDRIKDDSGSLSHMMNALEDIRANFIAANNAKAEYQGYLMRAQEVQEEGGDPTALLGQANSKWDEYEKAYAEAIDQLEKSTEGTLAKAWHTKLFDLLLVLLPIQEYERQLAGISAAQDVPNLKGALSSLNSSLIDTMVKLTRAQVQLHNYGANIVLLKGTAEDELLEREIEELKDLLNSWGDFDVRTVEDMLEELPEIPPYLGDRTILVPPPQKFERPSPDIVTPEDDIEEPVDEITPIEEQFEKQVPPTGTRTTPPQPLQQPVPIEAPIDPIIEQLEQQVPKTGTLPQQPLNENGEVAITIQDPNEVNDILSGRFAQLQELMMTDEQREQNRLEMEEAVNNLRILNETQVDRRRNLVVDHQLPMKLTPLGSLLYITGKFGGMTGVTQQIGTGAQFPELGSGLGQQFAPSEQMMQIMPGLNPVQQQMPTMAQLAQQAQERDELLQQQQQEEDLPPPLVDEMNVSNQQQDVIGVSGGSIFGFPVPSLPQYAQGLQGGQFSQF